MIAATRRNPSRAEQSSEPPFAAPLLRPFCCPGLTHLCVSLFPSLPPPSPSPLYPRSQGIALGSYITELREAVSRSSKIIMSAIFVVTVPLGCWVGIAVAESYDAESTTALWVTGALNALTGGMLLYNGLITFLGEEFSRDDLGPGAEGRKLKQKMYLMVLFGAAAMAVLGMWA